MSSVEFTDYGIPTPVNPIATPAAVLPSWPDSDRHFSNALTSPWYNLVFQLSGRMASATYDYFRTRAFVPALTPVTAQSVSSPMGLGSDSKPVKVELFGTPTYLVDSMQFHLEYILRQYPKGVFYIMPTFRDDPPDHRHLSEFFHIEAEMSGKLDDVMETIEGFLKFSLKDILKSLKSDIEDVVGTTSHIERLIERCGHFPRVTFREAVARLGENPEYYVFHKDEKIALTDAGEKELMSDFEDAVWLTHLPRTGVPFYQADAPDDETASLCADLLLGPGEIISCGERHEGFEETEDAIVSHEVDPSNYEWYLRMKSEFPMKTSGFGLGLERFILWILQHEDIRDVQLFVRQKGLHCHP